MRNFFFQFFTNLVTPGRKIKLVSRLSQSQVSNDKMGPLHGVVVYVTKKVEAMRQEIHKLVSGLGGQHRSQYVPDEVTHVVFCGKNNDMTKEFRAARNDKKLIVSPEWVKACHEALKRVEESLFPHSYNPKMSLNISVTSERKRSKKVAKADDVTTTKNDTSKDETKLEEVAEVDLGEIDLDESLSKRRSSLKMRLSSVEATPDRYQCTLDYFLHQIWCKIIVFEKAQFFQKNSAFYVILALLFQFDPNFYHTC